MNVEGQIVSHESPDVNVSVCEPDLWSSIYQVEDLISVMQSLIKDGVIPSPEQYRRLVAISKKLSGLRDYSICLDHGFLKDIARKHKVSFNRISQIRSSGIPMIFRSRSR